jgi:hypothetical protein
MLALRPAQRLAQVNYAPRVFAFAFSLLVLQALMIERGLSAWLLFFGVLQFLVYPHLAYLHARIAADSRRAELRNLIADSGTHCRPFGVSPRPQRQPLDTRRITPSRITADDSHS